jgi:hypothetical protein
MQLIVQNGPDAGKAFSLSNPVVVAGRQAGNDILLNDTQVSRRHVQFENRNGQVFVTDLGSANGSYINGQRLSPNVPQPFRPGDTLRIGDTSMSIQGAPAQPVAYPTQSQPPQPQNYQTYNAPSQGYQQPAQNYQPQPGYIPQQSAYQPQTGYQPQQPYPSPVPPKRKGNAGLVIGLVLGLVVLIGAGIGLFFVLGRSNPTPTPGTNTTVAITTGNITTAPITTIAQGPNGTNAPPPSPRPTTTAAVQTTISSLPTTASTGQTGAGGTINQYGISLTFPSDWRTRVRDEANNIGAIEAQSPEGAFVAVRRIPGLPGDLKERSDALLSIFRKQSPQLVVQVEPTVQRNGIVTFQVEYPNTSGLTMLEFIMVTENNKRETYLVEFGAEKSKFNSFEDAFADILESIKIA